jgi:hypothetical protein
MADIEIPEIQETPATVNAEQPDDDQKPIFNRHQVEDVVRRERQKALEKGKRMAMEELQQQQQAAQPQAQPVTAQPIPQPLQNPQASQSLGGMPQMSHEDVKRMIAEQAPAHMQAHLNQQAVNRQAEGFVQKMKAAEAKHPGLEARLEKLDWTHMGPVIRLIDSASNPGDIMKELLDNPMKMGNLVSLAHTQPVMAQDAVRELSNSIAQNHAALAQEAQANEPLGQITPSNVGSDTGTKGLIRDFKKKYRG